MNQLIISRQIYIYKKCSRINVRALRAKHNYTKPFEPFLKYKDWRYRLMIGLQIGSITNMFHLQKDLMILEHEIALKDFSLSNYIKP